MFWHWNNLRMNQNDGLCDKRRPTSSAVWHQGTKLEAVQQEMSSFLKNKLASMAIPVALRFKSWYHMVRTKTLFRIQGNERWYYYYTSMYIYIFLRGSFISFPHPHPPARTLELALEFSKGKGIGCPHAVRSLEKFPSKFRYIKSLSLWWWSDPLITWLPTFDNLGLQCGVWSMDTLITWSAQRLWAIQDRNSCIVPLLPLILHRILNFISHYGTLFGKGKENTFTHI